MADGYNMRVLRIHMSVPGLQELPAGWIWDLGKNAWRYRPDCSCPDRGDMQVESNAPTTFQHRQTVYKYACRNCLRRYENTVLTTLSDRPGTTKLISLRYFTHTFVVRHLLLYGKPDFDLVPAMNKVLETRKKSSSKNSLAHRKRNTRPIIQQDLHNRKSSFHSKLKLSTSSSSCSSHIYSLVNPLSRMTSKC